MTDRDPHKRARTADRDATIEVIESAFVDGQIGAADRDVRVGNALTATTLGELDQIIHDLQAPPVPPPPVPPPPVPPFPAQTWTHYSVRLPSRTTYGAGRRFAPGLAMVVAAMVLASLGVSGVVGLISSVDGPPGPSVTGTADAFELSETGVSRFLARYSTKFGTTRAVSVTFYEGAVALDNGYVVLDAPTSDGRARHESWLYRDGGFQKTGGVRVNPTGGVVVDLARLDLRRLMVNVASARGTLNVEGPATVHVIVRQDFSSPQPTVAIHVSNEVGESGYLATNLAGTEVLWRYPFGG